MESTSFLLIKPRDRLVSWLAKNAGIPESDTGLQLICGFCFDFVVCLFFLAALIFFLNLKLTQKPELRAC